MKALAVENSLGKPRTSSIPDPEWSWGFDQRIRLGLIRRHLRTVRCVCVLDLGCGSGRLGRSFQAGNEVVYVDISESYVRKTNNGVLADARRLPFRDGSFAYVVSSDVLEHLEPDERRLYLLEACRVGSHQFLFTFSTLCSSSHGASLFEAWFVLLGIGFPRWYIEHNRLPMPRKEEVFHFLRRRGARYDKTGYQGLLSITLLGFKTSFSRLAVSRTRSRFAYYLAAVVTHWIDLTSYLLVRWVDIPAYASWFVKIDLASQ